MISVALNLLCFSIFGSVSFIAANLFRAPEGYQDEDGFHFVPTKTRDSNPQCETRAEMIMQKT